MLIKRLIKPFFPILNRLYRWYSSKPRHYRYQGLRLVIAPTVFHPAFFFSTKIFIGFLKQQEVKGKRLLELGAGSGLISLVQARRGATVTATDINRIALDQLRQNAATNQIPLQVTHSDLFEQVSPTDFDLIIINPPYYPKPATQASEFAWYCGEDFAYFRRLFAQLAQGYTATIYMILSDDCDLAQISALAQIHTMEMDCIYQRRVWGEDNFIYQIRLPSPS